MKSTSFLDRLKPGRNLAAMGAFLACLPSCLHDLRANNEIGVAVILQKDRKLSNVPAGAA